jgi:hypothetical protein
VWILYYIIIQYTYINYYILSGTGLLRQDEV